MIDIQQIATGYEIRFQYKPYLVAGVKLIPGAKYNGAFKYWTVPQSSEPELFTWAKKLGFSAESTVKPMVDYNVFEELPELDIEIPLKQELFKYQGSGVAYALKKKKVIIGDEMGLGKTAQAIATVEGAGCKLILVICPATAKNNWKNEIENKWTTKKALILSDRVKGSWYQFYKVGMIKYVICNYESLKKFFVDKITKPADKPLRLNHIHFNNLINAFDAVIIDEIHRCKDSKIAASKFVKGICSGKEYILGLTGTIIVNKPADLISPLGIIEQIDHFGGFKGFTNKFCQGAAQASNLSELNYLLKKHCFYRRLKSEVLKDLPAKVRNIMTIEINNRPEYEKAENNFIAYLRENLKKSEGEITTALRGQAMVLIGVLKRIAARGKVEFVLEHIQEVVESGAKMVVFAWHKDMVAEMKAALPGSVTIVGDNSMDERTKAVYEFQKCKKCGVKLDDNDHSTLDHEFEPSDTKVILLNIKSGGVAITLTASSRVGFLELPWHPADCNQCEDRCHRIGQKDSVECMYFIGANTIDEYIYDIIDRKRDIADQVNGDTEEVETRTIDEFIKIFAQDKL